MKKVSKKSIIAALSVVAIALGLKVWAALTPIQLGPIWDSIETCAGNQL